MPVRLIALDIDGTLLNSRMDVSGANREAIAEATRRGIEVALVTGRRYDFAMPVRRQIEAPITMIVNNGALVRTHDGQTRLRHLFSHETARQILDAMRSWRDCASVIFDRPQENQIMMEAFDWNDGIRGAYYTRNRKFIGIANPLESCLNEDPIQVMLAGRFEPMRRAEAALRALPFGRDFSLSVTLYEDKDFAMIDILSPIVSKGAILAEWAALRGIPREDILAIGDNHNDLEMLNFVGIPVVMANGVAELKAFGWHMTGSNDEDGVAVAIERFALREAPECA
jgi:Cof subfamily protein (haloacid dehalogenase superfamily)